jgi:GlpG protein
MIYLISSMQEIPLAEKGIPRDAFVPTQVQMSMLYDIPAVVEDLEQTVENYNPPVAKQPPPLPAEIKTKIAAVNTTPYWRGLSDVLFLKYKGGDTSFAMGPLFTKIKEGEIWRLFSPVFLHGPIFHILFNMIWLWVLGKQIEQRVGAFRYLLLTLLVGVFANTVQYITSGPFFLGYSGVITGLAGFIWSRKSVAPWEGYPLPGAMILFLVVFIGAMAALQVISLGVALFTTLSFNMNIANSAHIAGALLGALIGRLNFFEARPPT